MATSFQRIQYGKGAGVGSNFTVQKLDTHYLSQVSRITSTISENVIECILDII